MPEAVEFHILHQELGSYVTNCSSLEEKKNLLPMYTANPYIQWRWTFFTTFRHQLFLNYILDKEIQEFLVKI